MNFNFLGRSCQGLILDLAGHKGAIIIYGWGAGANRGGIHFSASKVRGGAKFQCKPLEGGHSAQTFEGQPEVIEILLETPPRWHATRHTSFIHHEGGGAKFQCTAFEGEQKCSAQLP